jgi:hypothetical protein
MTITDNDELLLQICASYAPYDTLPAFRTGFNDYEAGIHKNPWDDRHGPGDQVKAQAWDRGANAAMRYRRATDQRYR